MKYKFGHETHEVGPGSVAYSRGMAMGWTRYHAMPKIRGHMLKYIIACSVWLLSVLMLTRACEQITCIPDGEGGSELRAVN